MESQDILSWKGSTRSLSPTPASAQDCPMNQHKVEATAKATTQSVNNEGKYLSQQSTSAYRRAKQKNASETMQAGERAGGTRFNTSVKIEIKWNMTFCITMLMSEPCETKWHVSSQTEQLSAEHYGIQHSASTAGLLALQNYEHHSLCMWQSFLTEELLHCWQ